jgi:murein L,D-transpeptidase YafK
MKPRFLVVVASLPLLLVVGVIAYAQWPITPLPDGAKADSVLVLKGERRLLLLRGGDPFATYRVALGADPVGHKSQEGDEKTPEGTYILDYRNNRSAFHRSLHVSYPNAVDSSQAAARGVSPGGMIMIHGLGRGMQLFGRWHRFMDWTDGCVAVTNQEMDQIWRAMPDGTPIEIRP